ncbi:MAG: TetR/AcrR family transcriptional regulator [Actinomycetota bacterium]
MGSRTAPQAARPRRPPRDSRTDRDARAVGRAGRDRGGRLSAERTTAAASPRRARARRGEGDKLREQILEAASRLLVQTGDEDAVSIRAVAEAVGVTPPSIYRHFADKNELIFAICERYFDELDRLTNEGAGGSGDPIESLMLRGRAYVRFGLENPEPYRVIFMRRASDTPLPWQVEKILNASAFGNLLGDVRRAIDAGLIEGDPMLVSISLWSAVHGLTSLLISKPRFPWPEVEVLVDQVARSALYGVVVRS